MSPSDIVQTLWTTATSCATTACRKGLREQLTYLLFLKMADERTKAGHSTAVRHEHAIARHRQPELRAHRGVRLAGRRLGDRFDLVLTNPPFGKSSTTIVGEEGKVSKECDIVERGDFWTTTSNKQLNFVQHVKTLLKQNGRATVVVPDNVRLPRRRRQAALEQFREIASDLGGSDEKATS